MVNVKNLTRSGVNEGFLRSVLEYTARTLKREGKEVAVVLVGENRIRNLNKKYRGENRVTDVLSFRADSGSELGDIIICIPQAKKQARQHHRSVTDELATLLIHGFLHLLGYDHEKKKEAEEMERLEKRIFTHFIHT